jgi:hypothetical protein
MQKISVNSNSDLNPYFRKANCFKKKYLEKSDISEGLKQYKYMDIAGSISLSLYIRDKEKEQHPSHPLAPV